MLKNVGIRLPVEILDAIDKKIEYEDRGKTFTRSDAIREAIDNWIDSCKTTSNSKTTASQEGLTVIDIESINPDVVDENGDEVPTHPLIQKVLDYLANDGIIDQVYALSHLSEELRNTIYIEVIDIDSEQSVEVAERWADYESTHGYYPSLAHRINELEKQAGWMRQGIAN